MMWGQLSFQDATSPTMNMMSSFHDKAMSPIMLIVTYVLMVMIMLITQTSTIAAPHENHLLEMIWTMSPTMILILLALPSLRLLYILDEITMAAITIKTTGHQWYWSYDYADFNNIEFDSYMIPTEDLFPGEFRLLEVDNRLVLPWGVETRILITAADVLHSWTIPSLGVKADAIPGRLNQMPILPSRPGVFYGQCSEICGANHSFMPITMEAIHPTSWMLWVYAANNP